MDKFTFFSFSDIIREIIVIGDPRWSLCSWQRRVGDLSTFVLLSMLDSPIDGGTRRRVLVRLASVLDCLIGAFGVRPSPGVASTS